MVIVRINLSLQKMNMGLCNVPRSGIMCVYVCVFDLTYSET